MAKKPKSAITTSTFNGDEIRPDESQGFAKSRAEKGLQVIHGSTPAACTPPEALSPDPCRHTFKHAGAPTFPVARLGKDASQS